MKKGYIFCLAIGIIAGNCAISIGSQIISAYRNDEVRITLNDVEQTFRDESTGELMYPLTYNNRTYLPLRNVANLAGLNVGYDDASKTAKLTTKDYISVSQNTSSNTNSQSVNFATKINFNNVIKTTSRQYTNYSYFDNLNFYVATVKEPDKTIINNMARRTANNFAELFNIGATKTSSLFQSTIHSQTYSTKNLEDDISIFYPDYKNKTGSLYVTNFKVLDYFVNDNKDIAVYVTFDLYNQSKFSSESMLLLKEGEDLKYLGNFKQAENVNTTTSIPTTISVSSVTLNKTSLNMTEGENQSLIATVQPTNATNSRITWTSSNESIATVANGRITAKKAGTAIIKVTSLDGNKQATCVVIVKAKENVTTQTQSTIQSTTQSTTQPTTQTVTSTTSYLKTAQDMYNKVNFDMTEAEVTKAIGTPSNRTESSDGSVTYEYKTQKGSYNVSLIKIRFNNKKVVNNVQIMVSSASLYGISLAKEINSATVDLNTLVTNLKKDMTFSEVTSILGKDYFECEKLKDVFGTIHKQYKWVDKNNNYCVPSFYDGKLNLIPTVYKGF